MKFKNVYQEVIRAARYALLQFPGTYELAFRDMPEIVKRHVFGETILDFGCGAGRSSRLLRSWGFQVTGIDISPAMLANARQLDPEGDYRLVADNGSLSFPDHCFDLIFSAFTFDNIPSEKKITLFSEMNRLLRPHGRLVNLVSTPEIYRNEWVSFTTRNYPENQTAECGDPVLIINTSTGDTQPVADILWPEEDYRKLYKQAGLELLEMRKLLARPDEVHWVTENRIAPWCVYVLRPMP